jgi:hypothetical protein
MHGVARHGMGMGMGMRIDMGTGMGVYRNPHSLQQRNATQRMAWHGTMGVWS